MRLNRAAIQQLHIRQAKGGQRRLQDAFARFLRRQIRLAAAELLASGMADIDNVFPVDQWAEGLTEAMRAPMARLMFEGAFAELALTERLTKGMRGSKTTATEAVAEYGLTLPDYIGTELPQWLVDLIELELSETFASDFWLAINETTRDAIEAVLTEGITGGWSIRRMAQAVENLSGAYTRARAVAVARTESSRSLNAGHAAGIEGLQRETGLPVGKEWLSVLGTTTRPTHAALDGEQRTADGLFMLGGVEVPYPSHRSLPAGEAINCFCTIVSTLAADQL